MISKNSLLATLGTLAFGATMLASGTADASHKLYYERCEEIRKLTNVDTLLKIVQRPNDPCAVFALQRIVDLTHPAAGPITPGGSQIAEAS